MTGHQFAQPTLRLATGARVQAVEIELVVPGLGCGIEQAALALADDVLQWQLGQFRAFDTCVDRVQIAAQVPPVMQVQRLRRQVGLQGGAVVGEARQFEGHGHDRLGRESAARSRIGISVADGRVPTTRR